MRRILVVVTFWLHYRAAPLLNSISAKRAVAEKWGQRYDKEEKTFLRLWPDLEANVVAAVSRATQVREHHKNAATPFPANPSTELDLLVRALDASIQPPLRILA